MNDNKRLIMFAGPSCVGKTTIINRMITGNYKRLADQLEIDNASCWKSIEANRWHKFSDILGSKIILHYDILRPHIKNLKQGYASDNTIKGINSFNKITLVTLWADKDVLNQRLNKRKHSLNKQHVRVVNLPIKWIRKRRFKIVARLYQKPQQIINIYNQWLQFTENLPIKTHWLLDTTKDNMPCVTTAHWTELHNPETSHCSVNVT